MKRYRLFVVLLHILSAILPCKSEKYIIAKIIPPATEVRIGNQTCGIGSEIDDRDTIFWNNTDTLIMNVLCNDKNCYAPRLTVYYPQDMVSDDEFMNLHNFLFAETKPLVGYGTSNDTIFLYPNGYSSIHIFQHEEDCLYAHIANSNVTFELTPIDKQYFISSYDFKNPKEQIELEIYNSPYLKGENKVKTIIVIFENFTTQK